MEFSGWIPKASSRNRAPDGRHGVLSTTEFFGPVEAHCALVRDGHGFQGYLFSGRFRGKCQTEAEPQEAVSTFRGACGLSDETVKVRDLDTFGGRLCREVQLRRASRDVDSITDSTLGPGGFSVPASLCR